MTLKYVPLIDLFIADKSSDGKPKTGVLTDGYIWQFFHLDSNYGIYQGKMKIKTKEDRVDLLGEISTFSLTYEIGTLSILAGGVQLTPDVEDDCMIYLVKD